jgi:hypothetical protein
VRACTAPGTASTTWMVAAMLAALLACVGPGAVPLRGNDAGRAVVEPLMERTAEESERLYRLVQGRLE